MALVLGLGNPGARYAHTRHNVGWRVVERLVGRWRAEPVSPADETYRAWHATRGEHEVALLAPLTFMNRSGEALGRWRERDAVAPEPMLVVADDVYLPLGSLRIRERGSSGGHRGLESIEAVLGSREYARLRIGVGAAEGAEALREHVLEAFVQDEWDAVEETLERAADAVECWLDEGAIAAMNRFNRKVGAVPDRKEDSET